MEHLRTRLRDLLLLLLEAIDARQEGARAGLREIREMAEAAGFAEQDMQDLLDWLHDRWEPAAGQPAWLATRFVGRASAGSLRQMGSGEDELLTPEAFGYLLDLVRTGQITTEQMETLIQFAQLVPDGPLNPDDLDALMDRVVFATRHAHAAETGRRDRAH